MIKLMSMTGGRTPHGLHNRGYSSTADRARAITQLRKHGFNYFVTYRDTKASIALHYSTADWVPKGMIHVD